VPTLQRAQAALVPVALRRRLVVLGAACPGVAAGWGPAHVTTHARRRHLVKKCKDLSQQWWHQSQLCRTLCWFVQAGSSSCLMGDSLGVFMVVPEWPKNQNICWKMKFPKYSFSIGFSIFFSGEWLRNTVGFKEN
jgi:hypothetical protein